MCCSINGSVCLVCYVFVNCLVKQFAICLVVVVILLLNRMEEFSGCRCSVGKAVYGLPDNVRVVPVI